MVKGEGGPRSVARAPISQQEEGVKEEGEGWTGLIVEGNQGGNELGQVGLTLARVKGGLFELRLDSRLMSMLYIEEVCGRKGVIKVLKSIQ